ncbi:WD repeat-containing protein WRAP73-like [Eurytemora carolleeae]|uniref:WD repeat-containing protein WRAP73-like n=1 Tax=Eurytemora carolleeae TaxID=1294199 RepID=UPI000C76A505|nr:WD repeat-containing protein WRAP73-like [Eurytemora carolleeae]|eukprot:XP_023338222.1 WD repeat-containing protein WRAP73-like [Eurytemora affinis]
MISLKKYLILYFFFFRKMNFSEPIKLQNSQLKWSDCGHLLASSCGTRTSIWDAASIEVLEVFTSKECIDYIEFSPDSNFILAANYSGGVVHLFSINSPEWSGRIYEGMGGILKVEWSQDSRHIITTSGQIFYK